MSDDKNPLELAVEQALDAFVYAPIGLVFDGPAIFPKLVEKGRSQVQVAKMMGQMAVQMGQSEAEKRIAKAQGQVTETLQQVGLVPPARTTAAAADAAPVEGPTTSSETTAADKAPAKTSATKKAPARKSPANKAPARKKTSTGRAGATAATARKAATTGASAVMASALRITDYDSLSASQVVSRLRGLVDTELDAVKVYESATRGRKTILNKIAQLQKD